MYNTKFCIETETLIYHWLDCPAWLCIFWSVNRSSTISVSVILMLSILVLRIYLQHYIHTTLHNPIYLQPPSYINSKIASTELTEGCKAFSFIPVQKPSHRLRTELYFSLVVSLHESKIILLTAAENWQLAMHLPIRVLPRASFLVQRVFGFQIQRQCD